MRGLMTRMRLIGRSRTGAEHSADVEGNLRGRANYQAVILIPIGHADVRLDMRLLDFGYFILGFENFIRLGEALVHVADINADVRREIFIRV